MAYPSYHPNCGISLSPVFPTWRQTNSHPGNARPPGFCHWPRPGIQPWNSYAAAGVTFTVLRVHCIIMRLSPQKDPNLKPRTSLIGLGTS